LNILFAGTPEFAEWHLKSLIDSDHTISGVITQPDKPGKRGKKAIPSAVKKLAEQHSLPIIQPEKLTVEDISHCNADIMIVVAYGQILRPPVLSLPPRGCINVHGSMLPRWRGAAPIQRAIIAGDQETGVCIIQMEKGLDTGPILASESCAISDGDTSGALAQKLAAISTRLLQNVLEEISTGQCLAMPQSEIGVCYAHKIEKSEAQINWSLSSETVLRSILGFNPDPVAFSYIGDLRIKVWAATLSDEPHKLQPGQIISVSKHGVQVACGSGSINITQLQVPLGKGTILSAPDIFNARREMFAPGVIFRSERVSS